MIITRFYFIWNLLLLFFLISFSGISSDGIVFFFFRFSFPPFSDFISILFYYCFFFFELLFFLSRSLSLQHRISSPAPVTPPPQWIAYDERST